MEKILEGLNEEQKRAVLHIDTPLLVLAGAGSGKTRVITHKIMYLHQELGIPLDRILAITFTNKAATEMKERVKEALNLDTEPPWIATFHSISAKILRREAESIGYKRNFVIYDEEDSKKLISEILSEMGLADRELINRTKEAISQVKQSDSPETELEFVALSVGIPNFTEIFNRYQEELKKANAMDFDDILNNVVKLFEENEHILNKWKYKFDYILVDEYQDTNRIQHKLLKLLVGDRDCLTAVGDPQQCIYTWRGATPENILEFENDFPNTTIIKLERNYRSTKKILNVANKVIAKSSGRWKAKVLNLWTDNEEGEDIKLFKLNFEREEARFLAKAVKELIKNGKDYSDIAILLRMSYLSRLIEEEFLREGIPYQIIGGLKFYERAEIKDLLAYFKLALNPYDKQAFIRALTTPTRGIGKTGLKKIEEIKDSENVDWIEALNYAYDNFNSKAKIKIQEFLELMEYLQNYGIENPHEAIKEVYERINYYEYLVSKYPKDWEDRKKNIEELFKVMYEIKRQGKNLREFLEESSLSQVQDNLENSETVKIMTIHASKGLEFPVVFLPALEEGIFPSAKSLLSEEEKEEERRLFYVGITRAKREVYLTYSQTRTTFKGKPYQTKPSRFLQEIKPYIKVFKPRSLNTSKSVTSKTTVKKTTAKRKSVSAGYSPSSIKKGSIVNHSKYGKGKVLDIIANKSAKIQFGNEIKRIQLEHLELVEP